MYPVFLSVTMGYTPYNGHVFGHVVKSACVLPIYLTIFSIFSIFFQLDTPIRYERIT